MDLVISTILIFSLSLGQLIRIPFGLGGITLLDITVIVITFLALIKSRFVLKKPPHFIQIAFVFLLISLISLILTPLSLTNYEFLLSSSYIVRFLLYFLFGWIILRILQNKNINFILLSSGINITILGILQFIFFPSINFLIIDGWDPHYFRIVSTFLDPNFTGAFLVLTLLLLTNYFLKNKPRLQIFAKIIFFMIFGALLFTFSRGAYLMFLISFLTLSALRRSILLLLITIILSMVLFLGFFVYHQEIAKPRNIDRTKSASFRVNTWQHGLEIFQKNPILGVGFNAYRYALREYHLSPVEFLNSRGSSYNDSSLLHILSTTGLVGFLTYLLFLFYLIQLSWKNYLQNNHYGTILISGLIGLIGMSFFVNTLFYPFLLFWVILVASRLN